MLAVQVPPTMTVRQLDALAALLDRIERGSWAYLAHSFGRLEEAKAAWPPVMGELLQRLVGELRGEAAARELLQLEPVSAPFGGPDGRPARAVRDVPGVDAGL